QYGVQNAVATLGTAITPDHLTRLLRLVDEIVFAFDGDNAGRKAAWRALENSLPQARDGKLLSFLFLPEGEDPDSFVQAQGAEAFRKLCDKATPLSEFLFAELSAQTDLSSQEGKVRLATLAKPYLAKLSQAPLLARALRRRLGELTGLEAPRPPREEIAPRPSRKETSNPGRSAVQPTAWRILLQAVLHGPARAGQLAELPESSQAEAQALHAVVSLAREHPEMAARDIVEHFRGRPEHACLVPAAAALMAWGDDYDVEADFRGALESLLSQAGRAQVRDLSGRKPSELTLDEKARLLASLKSRKPS
ncbi:MAG TPA: toprim domain-containing protein, partial [Thiobacillaceae bacterium]|nr:toprim domain-containing protein [Thiobacillaceae bacterium]